MSVMDEHLDQWRWDLSTKQTDRSRRHQKQQLTVIVCSSNLSIGVPRQGNIMGGMTENDEINTHRNHTRRCIDVENIGNRTTTNVVNCWKHHDDQTDRNVDREIAPRLHLDCTSIASSHDKMKKKKKKTEEAHKFMFQSTLAAMHDGKWSEST